MNEPTKSPAVRSKAHRWTRWYPIRGLAADIPAFKEIRIGYPDLVVNEGHWRRCLDCSEREEQFRWFHGEISEFASGGVEVTSTTLKGK